MWLLENPRIGFEAVLVCAKCVAGGYGHLWAAARLAGQSWDRQRPLDVGRVHVRLGDNGVAYDCRRVEPAEERGGLTLSGAIWGTYIVLWCLVAVLMMLVLLLYRQFGLMWMRPTQRFALAGLDIGASVPDLDLVSEDTGEPLSLRWDSDDGATLAGRILVFTLPGCPICERLSGEVHALLESAPQFEHVWITPSMNGRVQEENVSRPDGWVLALTPDERAHKQMDVPASPYAYVLGKDGKVLAKGLVNGLDDFEFLFGVAFQTGSDEEKLKEAAPQ